MLYRANFGDGTHTKGFADIRDVKLAIWGRAGIVQYRSSVEVQTTEGNWQTLHPSKASQNGPVITEIPIPQRGMK